MSRCSLAFLAAAVFTAGAFTMPTHAAEAAPDAALRAAVAAPTRSPNNVARDGWRHPAETLAFFGIKPTDTVVDFYPDSLKGTQALQAKDAALYGGIKLAAFPAGPGEPKVPDGSADSVLTFRNVHNWMMGYKRGNVAYGEEAFRQMFAMLKPGGTLGVVDHRLPEDANAERERSSGYVKVSTVKRMAEAAGFVFEGASEINANPKDDTDHPNGVWTLLPGLRGGEPFRAIGESDRMTLRFRKPA